MRKKAVNIHISSTIPEQFGFAVTFYRLKKEKAPPDVEYLIGHELLPIRPGRIDPRKVKPQSAISFLYRAA